ncbi:MAG: VWA domain-containing protein [Deltaproteobacteria bacterium]|nr:VWA domain-containing protein [Deltaproteobacteria bacterium]
MHQHRLIFLIPCFVLNLLIALLIAGCELPGADDESTDDQSDKINKYIDDVKDSASAIHIDTDALADSGITIPDSTALMDGAMDILRVLFPNLTEDELLSISVRITLDEIIELNNELLATRKKATEYSDALVTSSTTTVEERHESIAVGATPYPETIAPIGTAAFYGEAAGSVSIQISGVFRDQQSIPITGDNLVVTVDNAIQETTVTCLNQGETVDIVFLLDVTGSMRNVIDSVKNSIIDFVDAIEASGIQGTMSLVTFQDTVGVNVSFQELVPDRSTERSPFFTPIAINNTTHVEALRKFINTLEANLGGDGPENLAGAIDFARNNVIGYTSTGNPNLVGDGVEDPPFTQPFPVLKSARQVFVAFTDAPFHADSRNALNSSLKAPFVPRSIPEILSTLIETGTDVNVSDPARADYSMTPTGDADEFMIDADYWALATGGSGADGPTGYTVIDMDTMVYGTTPGLLAINLDKILQTTCYIEFNAQLTADAQVSLTLTESEEVFEQILDVVWY